MTLVVRDETIMRPPTRSVNRKTVIGASIAALLIVAVAAAVTVFVMNRAV